MMFRGVSLEVSQSPVWGLLEVSWGASQEREGPLRSLLRLLNGIWALLGRLEAILTGLLGCHGRSETEKARTPKSFKHLCEVDDFDVSVALREPPGIVMSRLEALWGALQALLWRPRGL